MDSDDEYDEGRAEKTKGPRKGGRVQSGGAFDEDLGSDDEDRIVDLQMSDSEDEGGEARPAKKSATEGRGRGRGRGGRGEGGRGGRGEGGRGGRGVRGGGVVKRRFDGPMTGSEAWKREKSAAGGGRGGEGKRGRGGTRGGRGRGGGRGRK